jgi:hypothetical protein
MNEITALLGRAGVDGRSPRWMGTAAEGIALVNVPGKTAIDSWTRLRALTQQSGRCPLLLGGPDELEYLEEAFEDFAESPERRVSAKPLDPVEWALGQYAERASDGDEEAADHAARLRALTGPLEPAPLLHPRQPESFAIPSGIGGKKPLREVVLALLPSSEPWSAAVQVHFGGFNDCPNPEVHAGLFRAWAQEYGAEPVGITHDVIEARVLRPPWTLRQAERLALVQYAYAPDIVDQGVGTVEDLTTALFEAGSWFFWWD